MIIDAHAHIFNADCVPFRSFLNRVDPMVALFVSELLELSTYESEVDDSRRGPARKWIRKRLRHSSKGRRTLRPKLKRIEEGIRDAGGPDIIELVRLVSKEVGTVASSLVHEGRRNGVGLTVNLPMDLEYAFRKKEKLDIPYPLQLKLTLRACQRSEGRLKSFIFFDPRRPEAMDLIKYYIEKYPQYFIGIKVYPSLGYLPLGTPQSKQPNQRFDKRLRELYTYCTQNNLPITSHCSRGGVYSDRSTKHMGKTLKGKKLSWYYRTFSAPMRWLPVLTEFPDLKLNLAHFGGGSFWRPEKTDDEKMWDYDFIPQTDWRDDIVQLIDTFPNVYTDISYHPLPIHEDEQQFYQEEFKKFLKKPRVASRVLFGTDMHLVRLESSHRNFVKQYKNKLRIPSSQKKKLLSQNAKRFLNSS